MASLHGGNRRSSPVSPGDDNPGKETGLRSLPTDGCDPKEEKCDNKHRLENCSRPQAGVPTERKTIRQGSNLPGEHRIQRMFAVRPATGGMGKSVISTTAQRTGY